MEKNWTEDDILEHIIEKIKISSQNKKVLLFLSGGVISTVAFTLLNKALGQDRVLGLHIDNGFMRKNESKLISDRYIKFGFSNFILEDDSEIFLDGIKNIIDSQEKTRIIGETFLQVHNKIVETQNLLESQLILAQGTLYPDVIKKGATKNTHSIKIHQTKVAGIQNLLSKGLIIEPLKDLYKEEVRLIGKKIGLPEELVMRHPFPVAGLSVNVICSNDVLSSQEERDLKKAN
ncbi:MAG: glutamine-hydrolyzing GMP synthase, partial [Spirochaetaceae bacterium]|nr:glutamine-hydrolyzing GMP synthase [Spirochaetaceae bacterium]